MRVILKQLLIIILLIFSISLFSDWELKISGTNIDLTSLHLTHGYSIKEGKMELKGKVSPEKGKLQFEVRAEVKDLLIESDKFSGELFLPDIIVHISDEKWNLEEGKGEWNGVDFDFKGNGVMKPFTYETILFFKSFSLGKLKEIFPTFNFSPYLLSLKGDFQVVLRGSMGNSGEGEIFASYLDQRWLKNLEFEFSWNDKVIKISQLELGLQKGRIKGEGVVEWGILNP